MKTNHPQATKKDKKGKTMTLMEVQEELGLFEQQTEQASVKPADDYLQESPLGLI